jgi:hypothetical protein
MIENVVVAWTASKGRGKFGVGPGQSSRLRAPAAVSLGSVIDHMSLHQYINTIDTVLFCMATYTYPRVETTLLPPPKIHQQLMHSAARSTWGAEPVGLDRKVAYLEA